MGIIVYALVVIAGLSLPAMLVLNMTAAPGHRFIAAGVATSGLVALMLGLQGFGQRWLQLLWVYPLLAGLMLIRLTQYGAVDFSGAGFTDEFFLHLSLESVRLAVQEYDRALAIAALVLVIIVFAMHKLSREVSSLSPQALAMMCFAGVIFSAGGRAALPEWQFFRAYQDWRHPLTALESTDQRTRNHLIEMGLLDTGLSYKQQVTATHPQQPKNVIVLYLESVGVNLADQPDWPNLMPNFKRLMDEHAWVDHVWASGYITIEGLTNTQCGTLVPFRKGSESIADGEGLADALPCLGDVLNAAGYHQAFLGGAETTFAGKGRFLSEHGFDEVYGLEHWREKGLSSRPNTWGLSDPDLFEQSLKKIEQLQAQPKPWHLSLLTIGTHLPGYLYEECQSYPHGDAQFLDALHCTDQLLGAWVAQLEHTGVLNDTLLVITADHQVFPNPEMKRLFGEGVYDRRLPMIVLGPASATAAVSAGAGYDLAPTILDLLDIDHDARFALGRSLAQDSARPDYFLTRYSDFFNGARVSNGRDCEADQTEGLPLNACQKEELLSILGMISERFSRPPSTLACGFDYVQTPSSDAELLEIMIGGDDQSVRFIQGARPVDISQAGWAIIFLDDTGTVISRSFIPEGEVSDDQLQTLEDNRTASASQVLVWTGSGKPSPLPGFETISDAGPHAWWTDARGNVIAESAGVAGQEDKGSKSLRFDRAACGAARDRGALTTSTSTR
jgi:phosphoglycerol transferase MdoB-like AlkP superfamily enzyme